MTTADRVKVFISHKWTDKAAADQLARALDGFADVWIDHRNIFVGDPIDGSVNPALEQADLVLVLWSERSAKSKGVRKEIDVATQLGKTIIPCVLHPDENGEPTPPLTAPLSEVRWVELYHFNTGVAVLAERILAMDLERLRAAGLDSMHEHMAAGEAPAEDARQGIIQSMQAYLNYLANYRAAHDVEDQRSYWRDRIIEQIEKYITHTKDRSIAEILLLAARRNEANHPEDFTPLRERLQRILTELPREDDAVAQPVRQTPELSTKPTAPVQWSSLASPPPRDDLGQRVASVVPPAQAQTALALVHRYLDTAPGALQAMAAYAQAAGSPAGIQVTNYLYTYLTNPNDLIPDRLGKFGYVDDAWLIMNTAFRLIESQLVTIENVPADWQAFTQADHIVRAVMPPNVLASLEQIVMEMLQTIAAEVSSYQPWFTPTDNGYTPFVAEPAASGGCWEDQMNTALLGTGLSV